MEEDFNLKPEKQDVKRLILEAAKRFFIDRGYEKTSIRNIAEEINYSPGIIYLHFKDKKEIFVELHNENFNLFLNKMLGFDYKGTAFERLEALGRHYLDFGIENPEIYQLLFVMYEEIREDVIKQEMWNQGKIATDLLKFYVAECQEEGYFYGQTLDLASLMVYGFNHGLATLYVKNRLSGWGVPQSENKQLVFKSYDYFVELMRTTTVANHK